MEDSRGQIILVAALAIAVTFVALALIVNTVIFTENLATRDTVSGTEAVMFQQNVAESGEQLMLRAQRYNNSSYTNLTEAFGRDIGVLSKSENLHAVTGGSLREISVVSIRNGTKINQSTVQDINDTEDDENWEMVNGTTATRNFVIVFDSFVGDDFRVNVTDGSDWWAMHVNSSTVAMYDESGEIGTCSISGPPTIGVTNGSVNGTDCADLQFAEGVSAPYTIAVENGSHAEGTYHLIVNKKLGNLKSGLSDTGNYDGAASEPTLARVFYNATLGVHFERDDLTYSSNVTLAPAG